MSIKNLVDQSQRTLYAMYHKIRNINIPIDLQFRMFDCMIVPILLYASEIWGYEKTDVVEKVHLQFLKKSLNVRSTTPNYMVYGETGRFPLQIIIKTKLLCYWSRILQSGTEKLSGLLFQFILRLQESRSYTFKWLDFLKKILDDT